MNDIERVLNDRGFVARAATMEDVDAVVDLINTVALAETGMPLTRREDQQIEWGLPHFDIETDTQMIWVRFK